MIDNIKAIERSGRLLPLFNSHIVASQFTGEIFKSIRSLPRKPSLSPFPKSQELPSYTNPSGGQGQTLKNQISPGYQTKVAGSIGDISAKSGG